MTDKQLKLIKYIIQILVGIILLLYSIYLFGGWDWLLKTLIVFMFIQGVYNITAGMIGLVERPVRGELKNEPR